MTAKILVSIHGRRLGIGTDGSLVLDGNPVAFGASLANGSAAAPTMSFSSDTDTGIYRKGANNIGFATNGTLGMDLSTTMLTLATGVGLTITDASNIVVGTSTGTKIGTATSQKLGFFNASPVAQQSTTGTASGFTAGSGTAVNDDSTFTGNSGSTAYRISDIVLALKNLGFLAA